MSPDPAALLEVESPLVEWIRVLVSLAGGEEAGAPWMSSMRR